MAVSLYKHQLDALPKMKNGCILCGDTGSGKSRTAIAYYYLQEGGDLNRLSALKDKRIRDLYIITTAQKRDKQEWDEDLTPFLLTRHGDLLYYKHKVIVDSWNNIKNYKFVTGAFFIFDEQRVVGNGEWVKSFLEITKHNDWILLSATPGDKWEDYIPVFIANGFYKNRTEFYNQHIIWKWNPNAAYRTVDRYLGTGRLIRLRDRILVDMEFYRMTKPHHEDVWCDYDKTLYRQINKTRWDIWKDRPIQNASGYCQALMHVVNGADSRQVALLEIVEKHPKVIVFYNYDYELDILRTIFQNYPYAEWNGHAHQPVPEGDKWVYLVNYRAGAEGWNCIRTDTIVFYSQTYSYKTLHQACGRIDRLNTPYIDLYYYHFKSKAGIDLAIGKALKEKKKFNEGRYYGNYKSAA